MTTPAHRNGNVERVIPFDDANRKLWMPCSKLFDGRANEATDCAFTHESGDTKTADEYEKLPAADRERFWGMPSVRRDLKLGRTPLHFAYKHSLLWKAWLVRANSRFFPSSLALQDSATARGRRASMHFRPLTSLVELIYSVW